jgi:mannose/cellobiose epimerase-like protein (N-acyl-D-glucosamine 2-epimerase family)
MPEGRGLGTRNRERIEIMYEPLIVEEGKEEVFRSREYRQFIYDTVIIPGCRLVVKRDQLRPDWPYVDTKFNPNTGEDLHAAAYDVVHCWFLGRGSDALDVHRGLLPGIISMDDAEKKQTADVFERLLGNMTRDIRLAIERNNGRLPFRANRDLKAIDDDNRETRLDPGVVGGGNIFAARGVLAENTVDAEDYSMQLLQKTCDLIREGKFVVEQFKEQPENPGQREFMVTIGALVRLWETTQRENIRKWIAETGLGLFDYIMDHFYDPDTATFAEFIDKDSGRMLSHLDPGHANEFVGFSLAFGECLKQDGMLPPKTEVRMKKELPRLLIRSFDLGFNREQHGLYRAVNTETAEPINDNMPWWNLPETMRAAARAYSVAENDEIRQKCLGIMRESHNAYFGNFLNPDKMLFPYQSRDGATGNVVDKVPAVPEGDPLYHTNLALLDMLRVLR